MILVSIKGCAQGWWPVAPNFCSWLALVLTIVGCYMLRPFAHPVACCWMLLRVIAQSLKPVKLFSQQLPTFLLFCDRTKRSATMLDPFAQFFQHCRGHAHSLGMDHKDLWAVFFPRCTAGPKLCCELLYPFAHHCQHARNNSQHCWRNNVGSCCLRLQAA